MNRLRISCPPLDDLLGGGKLDFADQVEQYVVIKHFWQLTTHTMLIRKVKITGFTGDVTFSIQRSAPAEFVEQINLLSDYAFFCGTGKKTAFGMGQTIRKDVASSQHTRHASINS